jgi:Family of unknown function (DUF6496)
MEVVDGCGDAMPGSAIRMPDRLRSDTIHRQAKFLLVGNRRPEVQMPEKRTVKRAKQAKREGKAPSTQAGEFVREEIKHVRQGKHGARSAKQAIAIGLSKARRAGVKLAPPAKGSTSEKTRRSAAEAYRAGQAGAAKSRTRSRASTEALKDEGRAAASSGALARQARAAASERTASDRSAAARKAARTKGAEVRSAAARKAARTRARNR